MQQNNSLFWLANRTEKQNKLQFGSCNQKLTTCFRRRSQFQHRSTHRMLARMNNATTKNFKIGIDSTMDPNPHKKRLWLGLCTLSSFPAIRNLLQVSGRSAPIACFPTLGTGYKSPRGWQWLYSFPRLKPVSSFCALGTDCSLKYWSYVARGSTVEITLAIGTGSFSDASGLLA